MIGSLTVTIAVYAAVTCPWAAVAGIRGRGLPRPLVGAALVLQAALMLQVVLRAVDWLAGSRPAEPAVATGYLLAGAVILPIAVGVPGEAADGSDGARAIGLAIACAAVAVVALRLRATWG